MSRCLQMETRDCPGEECTALGCARFSRDEHEWTEAEIANQQKSLAKMFESQRLSLPPRGI